MSKEYENQLKSYIHTLNAGGLSKMQIPPNDKISLGLMQSNLVFQMFLLSPKSFTIEIAITDTQGVKRRLLFSSCSKELVINAYHCRIPLINFPQNVWVNMSIDVLSFVSECFKAQSFRAIDYICLSASCKVRRICAMRNNFVDTLECGDESLLPKGMMVPRGVEYVNLNLDFDIVRNMEKKSNVPVSSQGPRANMAVRELQKPQFANSGSFNATKKRSKSVNKFGGGNINNGINNYGTNINNNQNNNNGVIKPKNDENAQNNKGKVIDDKNKKNAQWGMYDQNGRRISKNAPTATPSNKKQQIQKKKHNLKNNRLINTQQLPKDIIQHQIEVHSPNQNLLNTINYKNFDNEISKAINDNASIAEVVDFDYTNINNTILTRHDNNYEVYHDKDDKTNIADFIKEAKIIKEEPNKNKILDDIFANEEINPKFSIMETNRPYTPPLSKMVPLQDENNNNSNINNISKINESIIHNHYPEMVYDTKKGKYYNSKTKVYYDFK